MGLNLRIKVILVGLVFGALGSVPMNLKNNWKVIYCGNDTEMCIIEVSKNYRKD